MEDQPPSYGVAPAIDEIADGNQTASAPPGQQVVVVQQVQAQQPAIVYVDQYGNPIQHAPQQVMVVQQPAPQGIELQVAGSSAAATTDGPPPDIAPPEGEWKPPDDKHEWINHDELPPDYDSIIAADQQPEAPKKGMGFIAGCMATPHIKAWFFTLTVLFFVVCYFICLGLLSDLCTCDCSYSFSYCAANDLGACDSYDVQCGFPCSMTYTIGAGFWGIVAAAYLLYLSEAFCCSSSFKYLRNIHDGETIHNYVDRLHSYAPTIWWKVECYHYETRTRTTTDSDGNTQTETYTEKVVTHTASTNYAYNSWQDVSVPLTGLGEYNLTKLKNYKMFSFANAQTENDYNWKAAQFRRNNDLDTHQSFYYGVEIQDFKSKLLVEVQPGARGSSISATWYSISSLLLCTTCFRMHFAAVCGRKKYVFNKQVCI